MSIKIYGIDEHLNNYTCTKQVFNNLVITCENEMVNETINISFSKNLHYYCYSISTIPNYFHY